MRFGDSDHDPGLEAECIQPGMWLIESYDVERVRPDLWQVTRDGKLRHKASTLGACKDFIRGTVSKKDDDRDADDPRRYRLLHLPGRS